MVQERTMGCQIGMWSRDFDWYYFQPCVAYLWVELGSLSLAMKLAKVMGTYGWAFIGAKHPSLKKKTLTT